MLYDVLCPRKREGDGADAGDDGILKVKRQRQRQQRSFRRLRERAPLRSARSARMTMDPWISPTQTLWPAFCWVEENSKLKGKLATRTMSADEDALFAAFLYNFRGCCY